MIVAYVNSLAKIGSFCYLSNENIIFFFGNVSANVSKICKRLKSCYPEKQTFTSSQ